jgi:hypothetical protein
MELMYTLYLFPEDMKNETSQRKADFKVENLFPKIRFLRKATYALAGSYVSDKSKVQQQREINAHFATTRHYHMLRHATEARTNVSN